MLSSYIRKPLFTAESPTLQFLINCLHHFARKFQQESSQRTGLQRKASIRRNQHSQSPTQNHHAFSSVVVRLVPKTPQWSNDHWQQHALYPLWQTQRSLLQATTTTSSLTHLFPNKVWAVSATNYLPAAANLPKLDMITQGKPHFPNDRLF